MHRRTNGPAAEDYDILTKPWASVMGKVHPDDPELTTKE